MAATSSAPISVEPASLPGLAAAGVALRPYRDSDATPLFEAVYASKSALRPWMPWCHSHYSAGDAELWVRSRAAMWAGAGEFDFVIERQSDGRLLGGAGLNRINWEDRVANLGYWVRTDATRQGVASTAARLLAGFGLRFLRLRRIEILAALGNVASQRVATKAGATPEGVLRNRLRLHGASHDAVVFSFVPADFGLASPP